MGGSTRFSDAAAGQWYFTGSVGWQLASETMLSSGTLGTTGNGRRGQAVLLVNVALRRHRCT